MVPRRRQLIAETKTICKACSYFRYGWPLQEAGFCTMSGAGRFTAVLLLWYLWFDRYLQVPLRQGQTYAVDCSSNPRRGVALGRLGSYPELA